MPEMLTLFAHLCHLTPKILAKGDLPMSRVKFGTKHEYEYLGNYKVLQNCFTSRKIDKVFLYVFASKSHLGEIHLHNKKQQNTHAFWFHMPFVIIFSL